MPEFPPKLYFWWYSLVLSACLLSSRFFYFSLIPIDVSGLPPVLTPLILKTLHLHVFVGDKQQYHGWTSGNDEEGSRQWHLLTDWVVGKLPNIQCLLRIILIFWLNQKQKNWKWEKAAFLSLFFTPKQGRQHKLQQPSERELMSRDWWWSTVVMRTLALTDQPPGCPACPGEGKKRQNWAEHC